MDHLLEIIRYCESLKILKYCLQIIFYIFSDSLIRSAEYEYIKENLDYLYVTTKCLFNHQNNYSNTKISLIDLFTDDEKYQIYLVKYIYNIFKAKILDRG